MELMEGGSLRKRLEASASLGAETIVGWMKTVSEALDHAHRNNIVHAGLKPTSIVFDTDGHPYITDFALATHSGDTSVPAVIGAPSFLAPEQWLGGAALPATDQFALAVLAYYLITGTKPFEGQADPEARRKNFSRGPVPAHEEAAAAGRTGVPANVSNVLSRALSVDPKNRYSSTSDFAAELAKAFIEPVPAPAVKVKPKVFFSYCRDLSGGWATLFSMEMQRKGISVFIDVGKQDSAVQFPERLKKEIQNCDIFLCFVAQGTFHSAWVDTEIKTAFESGKPMLPILQESFRRDDLANPGEHIQALLNYNGVRLVDQFVKAGIAEAVRVIKQTAKGRTAAIR
jgi:serine/threonine protein kinase